MTGTAPTSRPEVAVGAIAQAEERILLVRRGRGAAAGTWSIPGGRVETGETLHEAVVREVWEETHLQVVVDSFVGWAERIDVPADGSPGGTHFVILDFAVTVLDITEPIAGDDAAEVAWVPIDDLSDYRLTPGLYEFLDDAGILGAAGYV